MKTETTATRSTAIVEGDLVAMLANARAPFVFFDLVSSYSEQDGIIYVSLQAVRSTLLPGSGHHADAVDVAHLRASIKAARDLRDSLTAAIHAVELLSAPPGSRASN